MDKIKNDSDFRTPDEELVLLQEEISGIRSLIREATIKLGQIERHVKRAFPKYKPIKVSSTKKINSTIMDGNKSSLTRETALKYFDTLRHIAQNEGDNSIEKRLSILSMADMRYLSQELGLPSGSKLSRSKLKSGILGRLNESILLSRNVNITKSRAGNKTDPSDNDDKK